MTRAPSLATEIATLIRAEGPLSLERYMELALGHPTLGYYTTRDPLGAGGDFITAPEISQVFGELLGLWAAVVWQSMGGPARLRLVELGPGRGTLMADALRAAASVPPFRDALDVHLVETSPVLREAQRARLGGSGVPVSWHAGLETVPEGPAILLANEFFDALPVRHYVRTPRGWCERMVGLGEGGRFVFGLAPDPEPSLGLAAPLGATVELGLAARRMTGAIAARLVGQAGAALVIDYGYATSRFGESLQALRAHRFVDPLEAPGEADLTVHVDFAGLATAARAEGAVVHGPVPQGLFLNRLGLRARAAALARRAAPAQRETVEAAVARLSDAGSPGRPGMGELFKVLAFTEPHLPAPPGFFADPAS